MKPVEIISSPLRAIPILTHPLRPRILALAQTAMSASELARQLGQPRQRINYHVRQLARAGFLQPVRQQRKRNMVEQQYVASASAYVLAPDVLGAAAPRIGEAPDSASAAHLMALCVRAQNEVAHVMEAASAAGLRARTMSMQQDVRFESAEQRADFTRELLQAVNDIVARYSSGSTTDAGTSGPGRPFRLLVGCYPIPNESSR